MNETQDLSGSKTRAIFSQMHRATLKPPCQTTINIHINKYEVHCIAMDGLLLELKKSCWALGWLIFNSKREQNVNKSMTCPRSYLAVPSCHQRLLITLLLKVTADPSVTRKQKHINIKETHQHAMLNIFQTANTECVFCGCVTATSI